MKALLLPQIRDSRLGMKLATGIILMFVPIVNIFAFGYLYEFLKEPRVDANGALKLPEWNSFSVLFLNGIRLLLFVVLFMVLSAILSIAISLLTLLLTFAYLRPSSLAFLPLTAFFLLPLMLVHLRQYQTRERFSDILNLRVAYREYQEVFPKMFYPTLAFIGLQMVCGVFFGISWFLGFLLLFASFLSSKVRD